MTGAQQTRANGPLAAAATLAIVAGSAHAQIVQEPATGPLVVGEQVGRYKWWDLQRFNADLEFFGEFRKDRQTSPGQPTLSRRETRLRGTTNLSFESYIGHKNLIDLTGDFKIGYEDQRISASEPGGDSHQGSFIDLFNIEALILGEGPAPLTVYSRRDETVTSREFNTSFRTLTTEHGAVMAIRSDVAPTRLQYFHREQQQTDSLLLDNSLVQDTFALQSAIRLAENQRLEIGYTFDHTQEEQAFGFENTYDRHDATLTHLLAFGTDNEHELRSSAHLFDQSGRFGQRNLRLDENLRLRHSDRLESRYNLTLEDQSFAGFGQRSVAGNASVRHKLFESLVSTATAGGSRLELSDDSSTDQLFVSGLLDYTKKVPYGRLNAAAGASFNHTDNSARGGDVFVVDEAHTFVDPFNVVISRRNILASSIRVTKADRSYTFEQGLDYTLIVLSDRVELRREPFGPNPPADGETVLVTYQLGPEPGNQVDTTSLHFSLRYSFDEGLLSGLSLYMSYLQIDPRLSAADPSLFVIDEVRELRYGAEYRIGDFSFLGEIRNHDSTVSPFDEIRLEARYSRWINRDSSLAIEFARNEVDYHMTGQEVELNRITGRWNRRLRKGLDLSVYLQFRDEHDSLRGDTQGFEQAVELHWQYGQTRAFTSFRNSILDGDTSDRTSQTFTVGLVRTF